MKIQVTDAVTKIPVKFIETSSWSLAEGDTTFQCNHDFAKVQDAELDTVDSRGEHTTYASQAYWCDDCQSWLDWEVDTEPDYDDLED